MKAFPARVRKLGVNPYVGVPKDVLDELFRRAGRTRGPIPVRGRLNKEPFVQTVVKYNGAWRLYLNTQMRRAAGVDVGDDVTIEVAFDPAPRTVPAPPLFVRALARSPEAKAAFDKLTPSRRREILRYLGSLKREESLVRNVQKVVRKLEGERVSGLDALLREKA